ncbi:MAG: hypothetical protein HKP25_10215 [Marinicaulis sp.]|nr:hypothetical protein [Marinicaulis sp.]
MHVIILLQLLLVAGLILIVLQILKMSRGESANSRVFNPPSEANALAAQSPVKQVLGALNSLKIARAELKQEYPAALAMIGGYLNSHTVVDAGSMDAATATMINDWSDRSDEVRRDLAKILADYETDEEIEAVIVAVSDLELEKGNYRAWLTWLLAQFTK